MPDSHCYLTAEIKALLLEYTTAVNMGSKKPHGHKHCAASRLPGQLSARHKFLAIFGIETGKPNAADRRLSAIHCLRLIFAS
jgi:hypothetical protein